MKFTISIIKNKYDLNNDKQEIINLKKIGFKFKNAYDKCFKEDRYIVSNKYKNEPTIEFKTIEDLINFVNIYGEIIISKTGRKYPILTIYNDFRE